MKKFESSLNVNTFYLLMNNSRRINNYWNKYSEYKKKCNMS